MTWTDEEETPVTIEELKSALPLSFVAYHLGYDITSQDKIFSPYNMERTPSCQLYPDGHYWDFSSGRGGDIIDLVMATTNCSWGAAVSRLIKWMKQGDFEPGEVKARVEKEAIVFKGIPGVAWQDLPNGSRAYYHRDWNGMCVGIKYRQADGSKTSATGSTFPLLWTPTLIMPRNVQAVVCEGESDAIALYNARVNGFMQTDVYALPSGAGSWKPAFEEQLKRYDKVWVCMDNDRAGKDGRDKIHRATHYQYRDLMVPDFYNDAREAIELGWKPELT